MDATQIAGLAPALETYLTGFRGCFVRSEPLAHLQTYVNGQLSDLPRKSIEPMALAAGTPPRTLQQFLADTRFDHDLMGTRVRKSIAIDHAHPHAVGLIDETSFAKKGDRTPGVKRQYCGARGKVDNCTVSVHLCYATPGGFQAQLDAELFLPEDWALDRERCRQCGVPDHVGYRPKWKIALDLHQRAVADGVSLAWMTFDEGYGLIPAFLHALDDRGQRYVGEVPKNFVGWRRPPTARPAGSRRPGVRKGPPARRPELTGDAAVSRVDDLCRHSTAFTTQPWTRFHIKDTAKGPTVWEAKAATFHLQRDGLPTRAHWLIIARNVLDPLEIKYFVSNAPAGTPLEMLLHVAFSRAAVERCFEDQKTELGMDHFEVRNFNSLTRHLVITSVTLLFLAGVRQKLRGEKSGTDGGPDGVPGPHRRQRDDRHPVDESTQPDRAIAAGRRDPGIYPAQKCLGGKVPPERNPA
jgi:SRSO17 transposase